MTLPGAPGAPPARAVAGGIMLYLRVTPKAGVDAVAGVEARAEGNVLAVKVRALPDKGEANDAVVATLAKWLGHPKGRVTLAAGAKARLKQVFVAGDPAELLARVAEILGTGGTKR